MDAAPVQGYCFGGFCVRPVFRAGVLRNLSDAGQAFWEFRLVPAACETRGGRFGEAFARAWGELRRIR